MNVFSLRFLLIPGLILFAGSALGEDQNCSDLPEWKRQAYYLVGAQVQYQDIAYKNTGEPSKRDYPDDGYPWAVLGPCVDTGGGGGGEDPA